MGRVFIYNRRENGGDWISVHERQIGLVGAKKAAFNAFSGIMQILALVSIFGFLKICVGGRSRLVAQLPIGCPTNILTPTKIKPLAPRSLAASYPGD